MPSRHQAEDFGMRMFFTASTAFAFEQVLKLREGSLWVFPVGTVLEENNILDRLSKRYFFKKPEWFGGSQPFFKSIAATDIERGALVSTQKTRTTIQYQKVTRTVEFYNIFPRISPKPTLLVRVQLESLDPIQDQGADLHDISINWRMTKIGYLLRTDVTHPSFLEWIEMECVNL